MRSSRCPLWLSCIGGFLLLPGIVWLATSGTRLTDDDASVAFQPLTRIDLEGLDNGPLSAAFTVPNTARWAKIRKVWGAPELLIVAVEPTRRSVLCLPRMPFRIELSEQKGGASRLQPHGGPYGYSTSCEGSSLRFNAAPGDELMLKITNTAPTAPPGYLLVVSDWIYTKDHIVGLALDKDVASVLQWLSIAGSVLVLSGAAIFARSRLLRVLG